MRSADGALYAIDINDPFQADWHSLGVILYETIAGARYSAAKGPRLSITRATEANFFPGLLKDVLKKLWGMASNGRRYADFKVLSAELLAIQNRHFPKPDDTKKTHTEIDAG